MMMFARASGKHLLQRRALTRTNATAAHKGPHNNNNNENNKPKVCWLDLQGCGLSAIERLCLEEALLRHDPLERSWGIVGTHDPAYHSRLVGLNNRKINGSSINEDCIVVMGIGGKPEKLLNLEKVRQDNVTVVKRFSGGGTVVLDHSSLWTTFIGRTKDFVNVDPYPREIMDWSADFVFGPVFEKMKNEVNNKTNNNNSVGVGTSGRKKTLMVQNSSCGMAQGSGESLSFTSSSLTNSKKIGDNAVIDIPDFSLRENDYVLGERKMGGNAQSIVSGAWLHHTSFLWDYEHENMQYLTLPEKRPEYRGQRDHDDFLVKLHKYYGSNFGMNEGKKMFFEQVRAASADSFDLQDISLKEAMGAIETELGSLQEWFDGKCRTHFVDV